MLQFYRRNNFAIRIHFENENLISLHQKMNKIPYEVVKQYIRERASTLLVSFVIFLLLLGQNDTNDNKPFLPIHLLTLANIHQMRYNVFIVIWTLIIDKNDVIVGNRIGFEETFQGSTKHWNVFVRDGKWEDTVR